MKNSDRKEVNKNGSFDIKRYMKKKWREETFDKKRKHALWEERRTKAALHSYYKQLRKENPNLNHIHPADKRKWLMKKKEETNIPSDVTASTSSELKNEEQDSAPFEGSKMSKKKKMSAYQKALNNFELNKQEKLQKKLERQKQIEERKNALNQYKKKRTDTFKKLSQYTSKGQPVMKARMQILLERIEKQVKNS